MVNDSISRCELFNRLATIPAPPEANEFKAKIYAVIQEMETADRPQGEWTCRDPYWHVAICSNCNKVTMFEEWDGEVMEYNYCPNCGARMKGADDE